MTSRTRTASRKKQEPRAPMWQDAAAFASRAHRNQVRKDGRTPYVSHVFRVTLTVVQVFGCNDPVAVTAALLHDTIEDTTTDYEDLRERYGREVADCVAALTKNMALPEALREEEYDGRLRGADWRARLVKLADVYDNYSDLRNWPREKQKEQAGKMKARCARAIALARGDMDHPETEAAVKAVKGLIAGK